MVNRKLTGWKEGGAWMGILLLTLLAYAPALGAGFVWDDDLNLTENPCIVGSSAGLRGLYSIWFEPGSFGQPQYYPLVHTTFWVEHALWGLWPAGYHFDNILLHGINGCLLWLLLRELKVFGTGKRAERMAWIAGAAFAVHPVCVESVAWVTERKNTLSGMFYLLSAWALCRFFWGGARAIQDEPHHARRATVDSPPPLDTWVWYVLALVCFALALLSKTNTCMLAPVLVVLVWMKDGWKGVIARALWLLPFFTVGLGMAAMAMLVERAGVGANGPDFAFTPIQRLLIAGRVPWFYMSKALWPQPLIFIYERWAISPAVWWQWTFPAATVAGVAWLLAGRRWISRAFAAGILAFLLNIFPFSGLFNAYAQLFSFVADHWQYLGLMALVPLMVGTMGWALEKLRHSTWGPWAAALAIGTYSLLTMTQCLSYFSPKTLWQEVYDKNHGAWLAETGLGVELRAEGRLAEAINYHRDALKKKPTGLGAADIQRNLGVALTASGKPQEAVAHLSEAVALEPKRAEFWDSLGTAYVVDEDPRSARAAYEKAVALEPNVVQFRENLALLDGHEGKFAKVEEQYRAILKLEPNRADIWFRLGGAFADQGKMPQAIAAFARATQARPGWPEALSSFAKAVVLFPEATPREMQSALAAANAACQLTNFSDVDCLDTLSMACARTGRTAEGIAALQRALALPALAKDPARAAKMREHLTIMQNPPRSAPAPARR